MRQKWLARWETWDEEKKEHRFTCSHLGEIARIALDQELKRLRELIPKNLTLERVGEPYELPYKEPALVLKTLYAMTYNTETPNPTTHTVARMSFFYAESNLEALKLAEQEKQSMTGPVYIEQVEAFPHGFTTGEASMQGKRLFTPDGKPFEGSLITP